MSGVSAEDLKVLLPCVAFSYLNGPWHTLWVKFNYDPRHDPTAKQYQVLDFRIGHSELIDQNYWKQNGNTQEYCSLLLMQ